METSIVELRKFLATTLMGWTCLNSIKDFSSFGTKWKHNFSADRPGFVHEDGTFYTEKEWDDTQYYFKNGIRIILKDNWHPDLDANQCFMAFNKIREKGILIKLLQTIDGWVINIIKMNPFDLLSQTGCSDRELFITALKAAKAAIEGR